MITRENYEIYFMDELDGILPEELKVELKAFLLVHPDLQDLLEGIEDVRLRPDDEVYDKKEQLKRPVSEEEIEYHVIARMEGVMTREERRWVEENVEREVFERAIEMYSGLRMQPDFGCRFEKKERLYRHVRVVRWMKRSVGMAAAVAVGIVLTIYLVNDGDFVVEDLPLVVVKTETVPLPAPAILPVEEIKPVPPKTRRIESLVPREENVERVAPVQVFELKERVEVSTEMAAPQPKEILDFIPPEREQSSEVKEPERRVLSGITRDLESSDNIVSSLIHVGRNVVNRIKNRDQKSDERL